jgi:GH25 family lysozyme M1 (1,4-beta-N-acetylmuramidase)
MQAKPNNETPSSLPEVKPEISRSEHFRNIALGTAGIISSVLIPLIALYYTSRDKEREVSKGFVEIATKILSDKPTDDNKPLREWAIALIDNYSSVTLSDEARKALLNKQPIFEGSGGVGTSRARFQQLQEDGRILGVIVSKYDGSPDFSALKERGIRFAFLKASQGATRSIDSKGIEYAKSAKQNGLAVGLYHVFLPDLEVDAQFANFANALASVPRDLPPLIDCEPIGGKTAPADYASRVELFATQLEARFGVKPLIYTFSSFANQHLDQRLARFPLFVAQFGSRTTPVVPKWWKDYLFWHLAEGVNDDPLLRAYDIVAFKGPAGDFAALSAGQK